MTCRDTLLCYTRHVFACVILCLFASFVDAATRPIPETVNIRAFAHAEGDHVELLVRIPLAAVKDIEFPTRGDGDTLDLPALKSMLPGAAKYWIAGTFSMAADGLTLPAPEVADTRISISSDKSFDVYETAQASFRAPDLAANEQVFWQQVWFDIRFLYALPPATPHLTITPHVASLGVRVLTSLTALNADGHSMTFAFEGDPGPIHLDPRWRDAVSRFITSGARLVAGSADFLLMIFCLVLPFRRYGRFLPVLVTLTGGLTLTLLVAATGFTPRTVWFDPLLETLATVFILLVALSNVVGRVTPRRRALFALAGGAIFGFLAAVRLTPELQFGGAHVAASQLAFGAGVLLASAAAVALLLPIGTLLFSFARVEPLERIIVSALAADTAWGWLADRWARLRKVPLEFHFDAALMAPALQALAVIVLLGGLVWFVNEWLKSQRFADDEVAPRHMSETPS